MSAERDSPRMYQGRAVAGLAFWAVVWRPSPSRLLNLRKLAMRILVAGDRGSIMGAVLAPFLPQARPWVGGA